ADHRWTPEYKRTIRESRVVGTGHLCEALTRLREKPRTLLCASAVGIYGETGDAWVDEGSPVETDFLARVTVDWEAATRPASDAGIRTCLMRTGVVLTPRGGALGKMLLPFRLCLGGRLGSGRMYMPWISLEDMLGGMEFLLA